MSIRLKILLIVLGFFIAVSAVFMGFLGAVSSFYHDLRYEEASFIARYERERVDRAIDQSERGVLFLSMLAEQSYLLNKDNDTFGSYAPLKTIEFLGIENAIGAGFWYEPYTVVPDSESAYIYTLFDNSGDHLQIEHSVGDEPYDYRSEPWYQNIKKELLSGKSVAWTVWDKNHNEFNHHSNDTSVSLMTTVGAGAYDEDGNFIGMTTIDWHFGTIMGRLYNVMPTEHSFALLACPEDDVIIFNTYSKSDAYIGKSINALEWFGDHVENSRYDEKDDIIKSFFTFEGVEYISYAYYFENGWLFSMQIPIREFFAAADSYKALYIVTVLASSVLLLLITFYLISRHVNKPLGKLTLEVETIGIGDLDRKIDIRSRDEIGRLAVAFNKMTGELKESIEHNTREQALKMRLNAELSVAAMIQENMLPRVFPPFPDRDEFEIYASMHPARRVGGDFYDFFFVDEDTLAVVIADVSDKGIHSAMFMAIARTLIRNIARHGKYGEIPEKVFEYVNDLLCEGNLAYMFVTAFLGHLNIKTGKFTYVNAGHNPPLVCQNGRYERLEPKKELVLGVRGGLTYTREQIELNPGDKLFLYTDGVTEAVNGKNELFGEPRLLDIANRGDNAALMPEEFINLIRREIYGYADGTEQADDVTMLALCYNGYNGLDFEPDNCITINAQIENLHTVIDFVTQKISERPFKTKNKISIAVDEVFSNIAKFAYPDDRENKEVVIKVADDGQSIRLLFEDGGVPFNPLEAPEPDISLPANERKVGGLGIFMLKKLMDKVDYTHSDDKNILTVTKIIEA